MLYVVEGTDFSSDSIDEVIDFCIEYDYHDENDSYFYEWVDEVYDSVEVAGRDYCASEIIREFGTEGDVLDSYRESENENDSENARFELRHAGDGEEVVIQQYTVRCYEDRGDTDGDETLEDIRQKVEAAEKSRKEEQEKDQFSEDSYMSLFQMLGGN